MWAESTGGFVQPPPDPSDEIRDGTRASRRRKSAIQGIGCRDPPGRRMTPRLAQGGCRPSVYPRTREPTSVLAPRIPRTRLGPSRPRLCSRKQSRRWHALLRSRMCVTSFPAHRPITGRKVEARFFRRQVDASSFSTKSGACEFPKVSPDPCTTKFCGRAARERVCPDPLPSPAR